MKKEIRKTLRFDLNEWAEIEKKLIDHKINFSDFGRSSILKKEIRTKVTLDLVFQIQKIGNNLNQIAKAVNSKKSDLPNSEILKMLIEIQNQIKAVANDS